MGKKRKHRNQPIPWMRYAIYAGVGWVAYQALRKAGVLGDNGDDYPYKPSPVVERVKTVLTTGPRVSSAPDPMVGLRQVYRKYEVQQQSEEAKQADAQAHAAQRAVEKFERRLTTRRAELERLKAQRNKPNYSILVRNASNAITSAMMDVGGAKQNLIKARQNVAKQKVEPLVRLEKELELAVGETAREYRSSPEKFTAQYKERQLDDFLKAAAVITGEVVAGERGGP